MTPHDPLDRASVLETLQLLIATPSVNPDLTPHENSGEAKIAAVIRDWFGTRGIESWLEEAAPGRPNAVARIGSGAAPTLILCAHIDTVSTSGMTIPPFDPRVEGNRVFGRGSYDMKGGAAAILCAMSELANESLRGTIIPPRSFPARRRICQHWRATFRRSSQSRRVCCHAAKRVKAALILGHKGLCGRKLPRKAARPRQPYGIWASAPSRLMGRIIAALDEFDRTSLRARTHPLVGAASQHCATVHGGAGLSTYAPTCTMQLERRTLPGETTSQVLDEIRKVISAAGEEATIKLLLDRPPLVCPREARIAECVRNAATKIHGRAPEEAGVAFWMDAALFAAAGIETINYGAAGAGAHEAIEWADLDSVVSCAAVLVETARTFCG